MVRRRADVASHALEPVPTPASTTATGISRRFTGEQLAGIRAGIGQVNTTLFQLLPVVRRTSLLQVRTIVGYTTDVEVYGRSKQKAAHAHTGALNLRLHLAYWAEPGVPLAAELMGGTETPGPTPSRSWTEPSPRQRTLRAGQENLTDRQADRISSAVRAESPTRLLGLAVRQGPACRLQGHGLDRGPQARGEGPS